MAIRRALVQDKRCLDPEKQRMLEEIASRDGLISRTVGLLGLQGDSIDEKQEFLAKWCQERELELLEKKHVEPKDKGQKEGQEDFDPGHYALEAEAAAEAD